MKNLINNLKYPKYILLFFLLFFFTRDMISTNACMRGTVFDPPGILGKLDTYTGCYKFSPAVKNVNYFFWTTVFFIIAAGYFSLFQKYDFLKLEIKKLLLAGFLYMIHKLMFVYDSGTPNQVELFVMKSGLPFFLIQFYDLLWRTIIAWVIGYGVDVGGARVKDR